MSSHLLARLQDDLAVPKTRKGLVIEYRDTAAILHSIICRFIMPKSAAPCIQAREPMMDYPHLHLQVDPIHVQDKLAVSWHHLGRSGMNKGGCRTTYVL